MPNTAMADHVARQEMWIKHTTQQAGATPAEKGDKPPKDEDKAEEEKAD